MTWAPSEDKEHKACSFPGCTAGFGRSQADSYYSRALPEGWVSVKPGYRCHEHHDFDITFEDAVESVEADQSLLGMEFGTYSGSDLDNQAVLRALRRGPTST